VSTDYRQGQAPFSGLVRPAGNVLVLQEEFEAGKNPPAFTGFQQMPDRWLEWTPATASPGLSVVDAIQQRAVLTADAPTNPAPGQGYQWSGRLLRLPSPANLPWDIVDPLTGEAVLLLQAFANLGSGPGLLVNMTNAEAQNDAALIVSGENLIAAPDNEFWSVGYRQRCGSGIGSWRSQAMFGQWLDSQALFGGVEVPMEGNTGFLVNLTMLIERTPPGPGFTYETELVAQVSTDGGRSWLALGDGELKSANPPALIGFGVSGYAPAANPETGACGSFDFLRVYKVPPDEIGFIFSPDGGRNWP
jgi:hypothetical protein